MIKKLKKLIDWGGTAGTVYGWTGSSFVSVYVVPPVTALFIAILGVVQSLPLMWVALGAIWGAAGALAVPLAFVNWRFASSAKGKLVVDRPRVMRRDEIVTGGAHEILIGFQVCNKSMFELEFELISIETCLGNTIPDRLPFGRTVYDVPFEGLAWFDDWPIRFQTHQRNIVLKGFIAFELRYGRKGDLRFTLNRRDDLSVKFDDSGNIEIFSWHLAPSV